MRVFSLFLQHRQIKLGERGAFGLSGHDFDSTGHAPIGRQTQGNKVVIEGTRHGSGGLIPPRIFQPAAAGTATLYPYRHAG